MKIRNKLKELRQNLYCGKIKAIEKVCDFVVFILDSVFYFTLSFMGIHYEMRGEYLLSLVMLLTVLSFGVYKRINKNKSHILTTVIIKTILALFGKYGPVISKDDWRRIRKYDPKLYRNARCNKSLAHCYEYSRALALYLQDACLMYCSVIKKDGRHTAHAVIIKNNCVYDTNLRFHSDLEEYKELLDVQVYRVFTKRDYAKPDFFIRIKNGFVNWCEDNNVHHLFSKD